MPKMKTIRAAAKRFSLTGTGKVKRRKQGLRHILQKKDHQVKKNLGTVHYLTKADEGRVKKMIPYA